MPWLSPSLVRRCTSHGSIDLLERIRSLAKDKASWADTLALPKSQFPARPSTEQLELYRRRSANELYEWQRNTRNESDGGGEFVLHDGPPYANGEVHVGHALNKVLKDLMLRSELSRGKRVQYRPGWDCHGLPIELKALQQPKAAGKNLPSSSKNTPAQEAKAAADAANMMSALEIRTAARKLASDTIEVQKASFRGWGVMGEWDNPYKTMSDDFEVRQLGVFRELVQKGKADRARSRMYLSLKRN